MLNHFLAVGGNEIINSARTYGYATTSDCPIDWLEDPECATISDVEADLPYVIESITDAPWYDPDDADTTSRFLGLYGVDIRGLSDSTRTASITEVTGDGATTSGYRHASREVRVRGWLTAAGGDALEVGMTWLRNVLEPNACGMHGGSCGETDAAFFVDCPPPRREVLALTEWATVRTNLWTNPRAVSGGGAFGASTNGVASFITTFPGSVTTARRFVASSTGISRITVLPLGLDTPAAGAQAHVMLHVVVTGGTLTTAAVAIRPVNVSGTTSQTLISLPDLAAGEHYIDVSAMTNAVAAAVDGGVVFYATTPSGVTVDVTEILVESATTGPYFDGETADDGSDPSLYRYEWTDAQNASTSTYQTRVTYPAPEGDNTYFPYVDTYRRYLHSVRCVSGPFVVSEAESSDGVHLGRLVEFTLLAEVPWVYGKPKEIAVPPLLPTVVQDIAYNLAPYPSAELSTGTVVVATNYSTNPSVETNATGWSAGAEAPLPSAQVTSGRVVGELSAVGTASYRAVFAPTSSGAGGNFYIDTAVTGLPETAGIRFSVNIWAAQVIMAGAPVRGTMEAVAIWRDGTTVVRTDVLGTIPLDGGALSAESIAPPAGADNVFVRVRANMTSWVNGDILRLYADAAAVTVP